MAVSRAAPPRKHDTHTDVLEALKRVYEAIEVDEQVAELIENLTVKLSDNVNEARIHRIFWDNFFRIYFGAGGNTTFRKAYYVTGFLKEALESVTGQPVAVLIRVDSHGRHHYRQKNRVNQSAVDDLVAAAELSSDPATGQKASSPLLESGSNQAAVRPLGPSRVRRTLQSPSDQLIGEQQIAPTERQESSDIDSTQSERAGDTTEQNHCRPPTGGEDSVAVAGEEQTTAEDGGQSGETQQETDTSQDERHGPDTSRAPEEEPNSQARMANGRPAQETGPSTPGSSDSEKEHSIASATPGVVGAAARKRKHSDEGGSGTSTDETEEGPLQKRQATGAQDDGPPDDADFGNHDFWHVLRSEYTKSRPVREKRAKALDTTLTLSEMAQFRSVYLFFLRDTFGSEGLKRCAEFVEGTKDKGREQIEAAHSCEIVRQQPDSLLEACSQAYQASRSARQNSAVAGRSRLLRTVEFYRSWSVLCRELKRNNSETERWMRKYSKDQGRGTAKGVGIMTLAWDWLIEQSYPAEDIATDDAQKSARHYLRDEITVGQRLHDLQQLFGDGVFHFLPSNTPSVIRRWQYDTFKTFIDVLARNRPSIKSCCNLVHQRLESPSSFTQLAVAAPEGRETPFESRVTAIVTHGMLDTILEDEKRAEADDCFPDDGTYTPMMGNAIMT